MKLTSSILLVTLSAFAFTACSDDDDKKNDGPDNTGEITFNATVPRAPRVATTTNNIKEFSTWAFTQGTRYMDNVVVSRDGSKWTYSPVMYWPVDDEAVNFFSVSPAIPATVSTVTQDRSFDISGYVNTDGATDMLYAVNMGESSNKTKQVQVNFRHALSQVRFALLAQKDTPSIRVDVDAVELLNIYSRGDFQFPRQTTERDDISEASRGDWENQSLPTDVRLYSGDAVTLSETENTELNSTGYYFALPQELIDSKVNGTTYSGAYARVRCQIFDKTTNVKLWPSSSVSGYNPETQSAWLYFPLDTDQTRYDEWELGKAYYYVLTVGMPKGSSTISFDVTVDEYDITQEK